MLSETTVAKDPITQFNDWYKEAIDLKVLFYDAMHLATISSKGTPSGRIVLLRGVNDEGFTFFTNYESRKGKELAENPHASLTFFWTEMKRQIRIEGSVTKTTAEVSDKYFNSRPRGSRLGAIASPQSEIITSRSVLEEQYEAAEKEFEGEDPKRPDHWGGYCLDPVYIEFWQDVPDRLHDRILYEKQEDGSWKISRLAP